MAMEMIDAGKCLKIAQAKVGMNSRELAQKTQTSPQQILRWRSNKNMKLHTIQLLSEALGVSVSDFVSFCA
jgi:transcriptional regulator with XRE-family HTH domain